MFNIDKNIPLPTKTQDAEEYPFNQMEIGDSFVACADIANEHVKVLEHIMDKVDARNEAGDGRLFLWAATRDNESGRDMLRVWRVSFADYIDMVRPCDAPVIECIFDMLKDGPLSRSQITKMNLLNQPGSVREREDILRRYAFLFKTSKGKTNGIIYEIA